MESKITQFNVVVNPRNLTVNFETKAGNVAVNLSYELPGDNSLVEKWVNTEEDIKSAVKTALTEAISAIDSSKIPVRLETINTGFSAINILPHLPKGDIEPKIETMQERNG